MRSTPHTSAVEHLWQWNQPLRWTLWAASLLFVATLSFWWFGPRLIIPLASYLSIHTLLEVITVAVSLALSLLIFGVDWFAPHRPQPDSFVALAAAFLAVGLLDLFHLLSYQGMPDLVTPSGPEKAIFFWLAARLASGFGLLVLVLHPWPRPLSQRARLLLLGATLAAVALCSWVGLAHYTLFPRTFIPEKGLTPLKIGLEYGITALYVLAAAILVRDRSDSHFGQASLLGALVLLILSELCFTLYNEVSDLFNLFGHLYKLLAYGFLYHAIFVDAVQVPYKALRDAEKQLRLVLDGSDDGFWDWNIVSGAVVFSQRWAAMLGYRLDEIEPHVRAWERLVHPDDMPAVQAALAAHFAGQTGQYVTEHRIHTRSGGWLWILDRGRVVERDADGSPLRMAGTHTDISARKQMEAELQGSQRFLQSALDALDAHIAILDEHSTIITVNAAWRRFAILNDLPGPASGIGTNYLALCDAAEGDGAEEAHAVAAGLRDVLAGATPAFEREYRCDGPHEKRWFLLRVTRFEDGGRVRLVIAHEDTSRRRQAEAQVQLINDQLAAQVSALEHRTQELNMLVELNGMLRACSTTADAYAVLASFVRRLFPTSDGVLYIRRAAEQVLEAVVHWGGRNDSLTLQFDDCWAFRRGHPHLVEATEIGVCCAHLGHPRPVSTLCLPLIVHGDTHGLLTLGAPQALSPTESQLAQAVINQLELTLANLQLQESLQAQAVRDPLTGLFNRRYLEETLTRMQASYRRGGSPFALLLADIDHFKQVNDSYGHEAGDAVLRAVSQTLQGSIRAGDIACRYGGEEFILVMVDVDEAGASGRAEELREAISILQPHFHGRPLPAVTISIGLAMMKEPGTSAAALIAEADAALYAAKRAGRNQVAIA